MIETLNQLIVCLREELTQYGELLALLETQQQAILERNADQVPACAAEMRSQGKRLEDMKQERETTRQELYVKFGIAEGAPISNAFDQMPPEYQPLLNALIDENQQSITRIRRLARQNHLLINRSLETVKGLIDSLQEEVTPSVYGIDGTVPDRSITRSLSHEHVC